MRSWLAVTFLAVAGFAWSAPEATKPPVKPAAKPAEPPKLESTCISCHKQLSEAALEPTKHLDDIHFLRGLSCHDCHGGDPTKGGDDDPAAAHDEKKGWKGKPTRLQIPLFCAKCHADAAYMKTFNPAIRVDQLSEYRTSMHGKRNAMGDDKTAVCIDCHGVHGIRAIKDPRSKVHPLQVADTCAHCHNNSELMAKYDLPTNQPTAYKTSVHAKALYDKGDLSAPTCNDCHGSHGAAPPGLSSVAQVCGSCHTREGSLYRETEKKKKGLNLTPAIQCVTCHDNHAVQRPTDAMLGIGPKSVCTNCHTPDMPQYKAAETMGAAVQGLSARLAEANNLMDRAERAGMEVSADRLALHAGQDHLVEARVLVHAFDEDRFMGAVKEGMTSAAGGVTAADRAFAELRQRRTGLVVSLVVIAGVIAGLVLKLKEIEGR
jgi:predicted CXXCH cytochrome family protein